MALKQEFANQIQAQIDVWRAQIKEHQERLGKAGAAASADYDKAMATSRRMPRRVPHCCSGFGNLTNVPGATCRARRRRHSLNCRKDGAKPSAASCEVGQLDTGRQRRHKLMPQRARCDGLQRPRMYAAAAATVPANITRNTFLPLHPGAIRYYRQIGVAGLSD